MLFDQGNKVPLGVATEGRNTKMRIGRNKIRGVTESVGEIAASPAGHQYLFANLVGALENQNPAAATAGGNSTHQPGGTTTND